MQQKSGNEPPSTDIGLPRLAIHSCSEPAMTAYYNATFTVRNGNCKID